MANKTSLQPSDWDFLFKSVEYKLGNTVLIIKPKGIEDLDVLTFSPASKK